MSDNLFTTLNRELSISNTKLKYIDTDSQNFVDFYSAGNKKYNNYNADINNYLTYGINTRISKPQEDTPKINKQDLNIMDIIDAESNIKLGNEYTQINLNSMSKNAAKIPKESEEYWDNTKRRNLNTAVYTENPSKIGGRGFGDIQNYDLFLNGIGLSTRQENPDIKPQNVENDRIFLTNHNYNYDKFRVTENLQCGNDTRYLNKKSQKKLD